MAFLARCGFSEQFPALEVSDGDFFEPAIFNPCKESCGGGIYVTRGSNLRGELIELCEEEIAEFYGGLCCGHIDVTYCPVMEQVQQPSYTDGIPAKLADKCSTRGGGFSLFE